MTSLSLVQYNNYSYTARTQKNTSALPTSNDTFALSRKNTYQDEYVSNTSGTTLSYKIAPKDFILSEPKSVQDDKAYFEAYFSKFPQFGMNEEAYQWATGNELRPKNHIEKQKEIGWHTHSSSYRENALLGMNIGDTRRTEKMEIQARLEETELTLNQQIDDALRANGISLDDKDRLDFTITQTGQITITGNLGTSEHRKQILEDILNNDDRIRSNLFLYQGQKQIIAEGKWPGGNWSNQGSYLLANAHAWAAGTTTGILDEISIYNPLEVAKDSSEALQFTPPIKFSFQQGKVFQGDKLPEDKVFSNRLDSLTNLSKVIGLEESAAESVQSFVIALEKNIEVDTSTLTKLLNAALGKAKLGDITKKITFAQDADGKIVIKGNITEDQKKQLAKIINNDSELTELIKTQSAKKAVFKELQDSILDQPANYSSQTAWKKHNAEAGFDLSQESLSAAREQLLKNFLHENGVSMSDLQTNAEAVFAEHKELAEMKGLRNEINNLFTQKAKVPKQAEPIQLLAVKRGELTEVEDGEERFGINEGVSDLKSRINYWINQYAKNNAEVDSDLRITDYTLTFGADGEASLDVKTSDNDADSAVSAKAFLMKSIPFDKYQELGLAILDAHDDEHGDVKEYEHKIVVDSHETGYRVESPEADQAAIKESEAIASEIGLALNNLFGGQDDDKEKTPLIKQMLSQMNSEQSVIGDKLLELQEVQEKMHDPALKSSAVRFVFGG